MKEFVDKLIKKLYDDRLTCYMTLGNTGNEKYDCAYKYASKTIDGTIQFINELAEEYKVSEMPTGWIPVSERLPSESGKYLVTAKNITGWWILENNVFVCDYAYDTFIFQGWEDNEVIAWCELPAPYTEGE